MSELTQAFQEIMFNFLDFFLVELLPEIVVLTAIFFPIYWFITKFKFFNPDIGGVGDYNGDVDIDYPTPEGYVDGMDVLIDGEWDYSQNYYLYTQDVPPNAREVYPYAEWKKDHLQ